MDGVASPFLLLKGGVAVMGQSSTFLGDERDDNGVCIYVIVHSISDRDQLKAHRNQCMVSILLHLDAGLKYFSYPRVNVRTEKENKRHTFPVVILVFIRCFSPPSNLKNEA